MFRFHIIFLALWWRRQLTSFLTFLFTLHSPYHDLVTSFRLTNRAICWPIYFIVVVAKVFCGVTTVTLHHTYSLDGYCSVSIVISRHIRFVLQPLWWLNGGQAVCKTWTNRYSQIIDGQVGLTMVGNTTDLSVINFSCHITSNIICTKSKIECFSLRLAVVFSQSIEAWC